MANFGEELRKERVSRGVALEEITAVTKIAQRHLIALEQERFRLLPGGILNKGIVRGYAGALGLDPQDWTDRFMRAYNASGETTVEDDHGWTTFASNVGRARILRREAVEMRLRWLGAGLLALAAIAATYLCIRFYGLRAGWWTTVLPFGGLASIFHALWSPLHWLFGHIFGHAGH
jgi:cytoskeleton protein RodZ